MADDAARLQISLKAVNAWLLEY